jgi:hypothetical protein
MRLETLCMNQQCCCHTLHMAVRLTPAVRSVWLSWQFPSVTFWQTKAFLWFLSPPIRRISVHVTSYSHGSKTTSKGAILVLWIIYRRVMVEAGKNASSIIPLSRKRRRKGNPLVSDERVMYGYESSATLTTNRLHYKLQIRPLVREDAPRRRAKQFSGSRKEKVKSGHGPQRGARHQDILTDWPTDRPTVSRTVTSASVFPVWRRVRILPP